MSAVDLPAIMGSLRGFQQDAVEHVTSQFYGSAASTGSDRFLIADETGLGKSVIAKGIIANAIHQLEQDNSVDRINIVYICSNRDLATQNLQRLNVTGQPSATVATRLSLLAKETTRIRQQSAPETEGLIKSVNLVSFTPGTSFSSSSWRQGNAEERSLIVLLLDEILQQTPEEMHATRVMFQGSVQSLHNFANGHIPRLKNSLKGGIDPSIRDRFVALSQSNGLFERFRNLRGRVSDEKLPSELWNETQHLIADFRNALSMAGVETLRPHLIILDEFQRFKSLLDVENGSDASELADTLFSYAGAKVLLLSATPYKPFTQSDDEENHYEDFLATLNFLFRQDKVRGEAVKQKLRNYRQSLVTGVDTAAVEVAANEVREQLVPIMTRSERPTLVEQRDLVAVNPLEVPVPTSDDLKEWLSLSKLGDTIGERMSLEHWKSVPYFSNFMDGYHVGRKLLEASEGPRRGAIAKALRKTRALSKDQIDRRSEIDPGNGQLRALMRETLDEGWWKLLWLPPSMPYIQAGNVYRPFMDGSVTKHVLFSSWAASPTSIAAILSHEADRRMRGIARRGLPDDTTESASQRLAYSQKDDQATGLSTLAIFWPHPGLLQYADQLKLAREADAPLTAEQLARSVSDRLPPGEETDRAYKAFFAFPGAFSDQTTKLALAVEDEQGRASYEGLLSNIDAAAEIARGSANVSLSHPRLGWIVSFSPGSVAYRSLSSIAGESTSTDGIWRAAFVIAEGLRTLFNRPESQALLDHLDETPDKRTPYWRRVLNYCADGNLRAVLDEYVFQLWCESGRAEVTDELLLKIAHTVSAALGVRPASYQAKEATLDREPISMPSRFAVRYGGGDEGNSESDSTIARQSVVRTAFNSPFAPFILTSTSVGQEGIDFHWWSHSVIHWNLPSNPVDFEQREGRVNRYGGHAVRKNVAERHWPDVLASTESSAWNAAFNAAEKTENELGEFSPWWVYPGPSQIQRVLVHYPLSRDIEKYEQLKSALTLYRLTLGQPRQEDMVELLQRRNIDATDIPTINLRPPCRSSSPG